MFKFFCGLTTFIVGIPLSAVGCLKVMDKGLEMMDESFREE